MKDQDVEVVPEKLGSPINFKIIAIIVGIVVGFHFLVNYLAEVDVYASTSDVLIYGFSMIIPLSVSAFAFLTSRRYSGALVYSKAYVVLGVAFMLMFFAELTYFIYEQFLDLDPYPSIADIFFFVFYPLIVIYLIINLKFFAPKISKSGIALITGMPIIVTATYVYLIISPYAIDTGLASYDIFEIIEDYGSFDFYYGIIFISAASVTLGLSIHTAKIFRGGLIGTAWLILVIGIILNLFGDTWYYYSEVTTGYLLSDPVNLCWYSAYLLILYALYKHKKAL
ncbi:MAG TPA: histidine kinase [Nitrosopumilus sp.]